MAMNRWMQRGEEPQTERLETWDLYLGLPRLSSSGRQIFGQQFPPHLQEEGQSHDSCFLSHWEVQGGELSLGV